MLPVTRWRKVCPWAETFLGAGDEEPGLITYLFCRTLEMPDRGAIAFIAGQTSELFLNSTQNKGKYGDDLELALFPEGNVFEWLSEIAKRAYRTLKFKNFVSLPSCASSNCLSREAIHDAALNIRFGMRNVGSGPIYTGS